VDFMFCLMEDFSMKISFIRKILLATCAAMLMPMLASAAEQPTIEINMTSIGIGIGASGGSGVLNYKGHKIPFKVRGISVGELGIGKVKASGKVANLVFLEKFDGCFSTTKLEGAVIVGASMMNLENESGVSIGLTSKQKGLKVSAAIGCTTMTLDPDAVARTLAALNAPRVRAQYQESVFFDTGSADIRAAESAKLDKVIAMLKKTPSTEVILTGYADPTGSKEQNKALSAKRASMVFQELRMRAQDTIISKLPPERVEIAGRGQIGPSSTTPSQKKRRVDILIISPSARAQFSEQ